MKKVLLVSASVSNSGHGVIYLTKLYKDIDEDVHVFVPNDAKIDLNNFEQEKIHKSLVSNSNTSREKYIRFKKIGQILRGFSRISFGIKFFKSLVKYLNNNQYDVVHVLDSEYLAYIYLVKKIKRKKNIKIVYTLHASDFNIESFSLGAIYKFIIRYFLRNSLKKTDAIICHGDWIKQRLTIAFPKIKDRIFGLDYPSNKYAHYNKKEILSKLNLPESKFILLFIGIIRRDKKIEIALETLRKLNEDYHMIIAGKLADYSENDIESLIIKHNIKNKITLNFSYLSKVEYENYFKSGNVFLSTHSSKFPSASGPVSDSRTYGVPVVVPPGGQLESYVNLNKVGLVSSSSKPEDFAKAIMLIKQNEIEYHGKIVEAANKFSWEMFSKRHKSIYNK